LDTNPASRTIKGRGVATRPDGRFQQRNVDVDPALEEGPSPETEFRPMRARSIISENDSPDIHFDRSINPYQGCEHGCVYCYARPSHSYLDLSPGIDFESRIFFKPNAAELLRAEWEKPGYVPKPITIGANTDPYQPGEKQRGLTRSLLELFRDYRHPVNLITKGTLMRRDLDLLAELAAGGLASVAVSVPTADNALKRILEPRVPSAAARFAMVSEFAAAGIPVSVMMAPVIPAINDREIEAIVEQSAAAGASNAAWILLRLPHELKTLFSEWLHRHFPDRAGHVMSLVRQASGGRDYDNRFGVRQTGRGPYAAMLGKRFEAARRRFGLDGRESPGRLDCSRFRRPGDTQISLSL
jgi:DNA repair photolyase